MNKSNNKITLNHEQLAFIIESLCNRKDEAVNFKAEENPDSMVSAYMDGVIEEANSLLKILMPCSTVVIDNTAIL
tara:strand:+ start:1434 stop:1658 length:225 start_codon:yes stop_codon:yes gene_type:complete